MSNTTLTQNSKNVKLTPACEILTFDEIASYKNPHRTF